MRLTAFLRGKRDGGGVPSIVRILSDLARFSNPLGKAAKTRDFGGGLILILLLKQTIRLPDEKCHCNCSLSPSVCPTEDTFLGHLPDHLRAGEVSQQVAVARSARGRQCIGLEKVGE